MSSSYERAYVLQDANWNVTSIVNLSAAIQERYIYDPYGLRTVLDASWNPLSASAYDWVYGHQGGRFDIDVELYSFRYRDFCPALMRFGTLDSLRFERGGPNLFLCEGNCPTTGIDPYGLQDNKPTQNPRPAQPNPSDFPPGYMPPWNPKPSPPNPDFPPGYVPSWDPSRRTPGGYPPGYVPPIGVPTPPPPPIGPKFPGPGKMTLPKKNVTTLWDANICLCPVEKSRRLKPSQNMRPPASNQIPMGPAGGNHQWYGIPSTQMIGAGGCGPCIGVVVKCPGGIAVFHFTAGDWVCPTIPAGDWTGCTAFVCGGDNSWMSNCLADEALDCLRLMRIPIEGVSGKSCCGVNPDGSWYEAH